MSTIDPIPLTDTGQWNYFSVWIKETPLQTVSDNSVPEKQYDNLHISFESWIRVFCTAYPAVSEKCLYPLLLYQTITWL